MPIRSRWPALALVGAVAAGGLLLVTRSSTRTGQRLVLRRIPEDAEIVDLAKLADRVNVFSWVFRTADDIAPWQVANLDPRAAMTGAGLQVRFPRRDPRQRPYLVRLLGLEAGQVDGIEVVIAGPRRDFRDRGIVQLFWAASGQEFAEERSLRLNAVQVMGEYVTTYVFPVATHLRWRGRIDRLRLDPTSQYDESVELRSVRGVKYEMSPGNLQAEAPRRVSLGGDLRNALVAFPERSLEWRIAVLSHSSFAFSYGVPEGVDVPVRFSVSVERAGAPSRSVFERVVGSDPASPRGVWNEASVDLSAYAGGSVKLVMAARAAGPLSPLSGLPSWGNPEVWRRSPERLPPNLVLISLDTLRADHLSLYGYGRETSPNLDRWSRRRAAVFTQAVAPSPWTLPSHASLFTGLDALRHGVNQGEAIPRSLKTLPERLHQAGYATVAVTGGGYLSRDYGFDRGFDSFSAWPAVGDPAEISGGVNRARRWLRALRDRPFFLFFHTYAIHPPLRPRQPFFSRFSGGAAEPPAVVPLSVPPVAADGYLVRARLPEEPGVGTVNTLYDAGVALADEQVGKLLEELRTLDLERRTAVVLVSDHGEALGERGLANHFYLYDFNLLVPLVVSLPDGRGAGRRVPQQVRLLDVAPTLLELAGIKPPPDLDGASLLPLLEGGPGAKARDAWSYAASTNFGVSLRTSAGDKYIFNNTAWSSLCGKEEMYELATDPSEKSSHVPSGGKADDLRHRTGEFLRAKASGVSVHFANGSSAAYEGSLEGPALHQVRAKTYGLPCPAVSWNERLGRIDFTVKPGEAFTVLLESLHPGPLRVRGTGPGAPRHFEASLDSPDLARPWQVAYDGSAWHLRPTDASLPKTGIVVRWVGDWRLPGAAASDVDQTTNDQLRALGYVH